MPGFQFYFELIGAVAFAISGAALAVKKHMDLFGVAVMLSLIHISEPTRPY